MPSSSDMPARRRVRLRRPELAAATRDCLRAARRVHDRLNSRSASRRARVSSNLRRVERLRRSPPRGGRAPSAGTRRRRRSSRASSRARVVDLIGQHVDEELVGRIGRQARAPVAHQVAAHDGQQQQRHQAERQRADLQARRERAPAQVGKAEAPRHAALRQPLQQRRAAPMPRSAAATSRPATPPTMMTPACTSPRLPGDQQRDRRRRRDVGEDARRRAAAAGRGEARATAARSRARPAAAAQTRTAAARRSPNAATPGTHVGGGRPDATPSPAASPATAGRRARRPRRSALPRRPAPGTATKNSASVCATDAPKQRNIAAASRCRRR